MRRTIPRFIYVLFTLIMASTCSAEQPADFFIKTPPNIQAFIEKSPPLTTKELKRLVTGNTVVGHTCHTQALYELFFEKDGVLIFRKSRDMKQIYIGKWWVKDNHIFSQWKTYLKKPTINELEYHQLMGNIYVPYNVNEACGPAGTFGVPFMVFKDDPFDLSALRTKH